ncbi:10966_t:CDS:1, partial [Gigaspora margarita]
FKKVVAMTQLRTEILQNRKSKEISKVRENFYNTNATTPLPRENSDSLSEVQKESSNNYNVSDDEDTEEDEEGDIMSVTGWETLVNRWIALLEDEFQQETEDNENEELELNSSRIGETHPADDNNSKWLLQDLFEDSL